MNYTDITNIVFQYAANYQRQNDFQIASQEIQRIIYSMSKEELLPLINQIGVIPEKIEHDSREEKLYSKTSEILLGKCLEELGYSATLFVTRSDTADVFAKSKFHGYSLVLDAKVFRVSRTAKNQKDFKVESMDAWRGDNDYAALCCPYYQYPKTKSAIFKQSLDKKVSLLSWEHFSFLIKNEITETLDTNLSYIWNFPLLQSQRTTMADSDNNYFEAQNSYIVDKTKLSMQSFTEFLAQSKAETIERCVQEQGFWKAAKANIRQYTREQAINALISSLKINQKIEQIERFKQGLVR